MHATARAARRGRRVRLASNHEVVGSSRGDRGEARFLTGDFVTGLKFVTAVTDAAETANHHPDVSLTYPLVGLDR